MNRPGNLAFVLLFISALALTPSSIHAQLVEVKQTVFGMDCAPCAYGLEQQIKNFEDVESISVSLNEGLATIQLARKNSLRLAKLRTAIQESGFSAREANVRVFGTLTKEDGQWTLVTPAGERFLLEELAQNASEVDLQAAANGQVMVTGTVPKEKNIPGKTWTLRVATLKPQT